MILAAFVAAVLASDDKPPAVRLGEVIFSDSRFSSRNGDMHASCASCHMASDPQGDRAFTELLARSWHPWRTDDPGRDTLRNTPTLLDVGVMPALHYDGEFGSLEEQSRKTLVGRNLGWLPGEETSASAQIHSVVTGDVEYRELFRAAFDADVADISEDDLLDYMARALAEFMRSLQSPHDSPYDQFIASNALDPAPNVGEDAKAYGTRLLAAAAKLDAAGALKFPERFPAAAYEGFKIFFQTSGATKAGNCVACHTPPHFTDLAFHNIGVTQEEYDKVHGFESFLKLAIPGASEAQRPAKNLMRIAVRRDPAAVDLGFWNFVDLKESPYRADGETDEAFLGRMIAAFKTPTLRHLGSTDPYMHNGAYSNLEGVLEQKMVAALRARTNQLRNPDQELANMHFSEDDVPALFAFLNALNGKGGRISMPRVDSPDGGGSYNYNYSNRNYPSSN